MPDQRYEIRVRGRMSQRAGDAFAFTDVADVSADTVISGLVHHHKELHEMLETIQMLGLQVVSVQQVRL